MNDCIGREFEIIARAKQALLDSTNIDTSPDEMACLDSFLFRCWQMGWLDKYEKVFIEVGKAYPWTEVEKYSLFEWKDEYGQKWVMIEREENE
jgi:hypothetical protein